MYEVSSPGNNYIPNNYNNITMKCFYLKRYNIIIIIYLVSGHDFIRAQYTDYYIAAVYENK